MVKFAKKLQKKYHITFNLTKSKLFCFIANNDYAPHITFKGQQVAVVTQDKHIGNYISNSINDRRIIDNLCDLYQRSNLLISQFRSGDRETLDWLQMTYCMHIYGCELRDFVEKFK